MEQQKIKSKQNLNNIPTELEGVERSILMKEVNPRSFWACELGTQEGINVTV